MPLPVLFDGYPQSIPRKDAIFLLTDLRKENIIDKLTASGCGEVWYRAWFGTKRPRVRIPTLRPSSSRTLYRSRRLFFLKRSSAHSLRRSSSPQKVTLRFRCSLVNVLATLTFATNFLRVRLRYIEFFQILSFHSYHRKTPLTSEPLWFGLNGVLFYYQSIVIFLI